MKLSIIEAIVTILSVSLGVSRFQGRSSSVTGQLLGLFLCYWHYRGVGQIQWSYCQSSVAHARKKIRARAHKAVNPMIINSFSC